MMAAISAGRRGAKVTILERNPRIGKKLLATGNGRCNFTNIKIDKSCYFGEDSQFAGQALAIFGSQQAIDFFEQLGIAPRIEDLGKVFPMSDQASSILDLLMYELKKLDVNIVCDAFVQKITKLSKTFHIQLENGTKFTGDQVIIATGGKAMPASGSDGYGFELAKGFGHTITEIFPALVQLKLEGSFFKQIEGVKFVGTAEVLDQNKTLAKDRGDILFGNYGVSGPPILQISRKAGELLKEDKEAILRLTLIDQISKKDLKQLLAARFHNSSGKTLDFSLVGLINKRLIPVVLKEAGIKELKSPAANISPKELDKILHILTDWRLKIKGTKGWPSAQVTAGGIKTKEINPTTMESKIVPGLFFAGEIMDIDGLCGGFNLHWAWCSGYIAGNQI